MIVYALLFLVIMLLLPRGILPTIQDRLRLRRRRRRADAAAGPPGDPTLPDRNDAASMLGGEMS